MVKDRIMDAVSFQMKTKTTKGIKRDASLYP